MATGRIDSDLSILSSPFLDLPSISCTYKRWCDKLTYTAFGAFGNGSNKANDESKATTGASTNLGTRRYSAERCRRVANQSVCNTLGMQYSHRISYQHTELPTNEVGGPETPIESGKLTRSVRISWPYGSVSA